MSAEGPRRDEGEPPQPRREYSFEERVLHAFFRAGRLTSIPAQDRKKLVVLQYLAERCFDEDRSYSEQEVNERLRAYNEDFAALRRYLVEMGFMTRTGGQYRRAGERRS